MQLMQIKSSELMLTGWNYATKYNENNLKETSKQTKVEQAADTP